MDFSCERRGFCTSCAARRRVESAAVLNIVYRAIGAHLVSKARLTQATARTGAVMLIQRLGSALNLNIHFHLLVLDGVYELGQVRRTPAEESSGS